LWLLRHKADTINMTLDVDSLLCRWIGVLSSYLLRPSAKSQQRLADFRAANDWQSPVVGVHIRRTDKVTSSEAKLHSIDEYMMHVERFCDWRLGAGWQQKQKAAAAQAAAATTAPMAAAAAASDGAAAAAAQTNTTTSVASDQTAGRCTVYLATDEPAVVEEIKSRFGHIHVITNKVALDTGEAFVACNSTAQKQTTSVKQAALHPPQDWHQHHLHSLWVEMRGPTSFCSLQTCRMMRVTDHPVVSTCRRCVCARQREWRNGHLRRYNAPGSC
jgi:hypothetical protein